MTPEQRKAQIATADLARRAWKILVRMRWEDPDVTAARRAELEHELTLMARRERRRRRSGALRQNVQKTV